MNRIFFFMLFSILVTSCQRSTVSHYSSENTLNMGLPFSDAVIIGDMIYLSGQVGNIPGEMKLVDGGIGPETRQTMKNIEAVLKANDSGLEDIIKCTIMMDDIAEWSSFNEEYITFFPGKKPARSAFGAEGLALGASVEIECIACRGCDE